MARGKQRSPRGMEKGQFWRGYRRPILRDGVFWFAMLVAVVGIAVQSPLADWKGQTVDWVVLVVSVLLTFAAAFIIIGVIAATVRGFGEGWKAAEPPKPAARSAATPPPAAPVAEAPPAAQPSPAPEPEPAASATSATSTAAGKAAAALAMPKKARVFGRAVGAARKTYREMD